MAHYHYLTLCNHERIPFFKEEQGKKPKFCSQFSKLWKLLYSAGEGSFPISSGVVTSFDIPNKLVSKLVGRQELIDPTSIARIYTFTNEDLYGPVTNSGYELNLYNDELSYEIKWQVKENVEGFIIGFYRSDGYPKDNTNTFSLVCGNKGASIFGKTCGSFICPGITNLYVASNKNVIINMEVRAIIPDKVIYPTITENKPYQKFITIQDREHNYFRLLAYEIRVIPNTNNVIKKPGKHFISATKAIQKYLLDTGLSVSLVSNNKATTRQPVSLETCPTCVGNSICNSSIIGTVRQSTLRLGGRVITDATKTCTKVYCIEKVCRGIRLNPPSGKVSNISFIIKTNTKNIPTYNVSVSIQYIPDSRDRIPITHNKLNKQGRLDGYAMLNRDVSPSEEAIFKGEFRISETAQDFIISVEYHVTANVSEDEIDDAITKLTDNTTFDSIIILYQDKVMS